MSINLDGFEPKAPETLDSSMIGTYLSCPQKFYLEYILGLKPKGEKVALTFGTLWHDVMELMETSGVGDAVELIESNIATFSIHDQKNRTAQRMKEDLAAYMIKYTNEDKLLETLALEQAFDLELPNGIRYCGRMDKVEKNKTSKKVGVRDYKTTTFFTKNYFDNHELGIQIKGYIWALQQLMPADEVDHAVLDVYHILKNETKWYRRTFNYRPALIQEWLVNICMIADEIMNLVANHLHEPEYWYLNAGQRCSDYGGCQFLLVHQLPPERGNRERLLAHEFEIRRWDPVTHGQDPNKPEG